MQVSDLVRYDPIKDCFVLKDFMTQPTWPDGTPKSMNNAFNWRVGTATAIPFVGNVNHRSLDLSSADNVRTYAKAKKGTKPINPKAYGRGTLFTIKKQ